MKLVRAQINGSMDASSSTWLRKSIHDRSKVSPLWGGDRSRRSPHSRHHAAIAPATNRQLRPGGLRPLRRRRGSVSLVNRAVEVEQAASRVREVGHCGLPRPDAEKDIAVGLVANQSYFESRRLKHFHPVVPPEQTECVAVADMANAPVCVFEQVRHVDEVRAGGSGS